MPTCTHPPTHPPIIHPAASSSQQPIATNQPTNQQLTNQQLTNQPTNRPPCRFIKQAAEAGSLDDSEETEWEAEDATTGVNGTTGSSGGGLFGIFGSAFGRGSASRGGGKGTDSEDASSGSGSGSSGAARDAKGRLLPQPRQKLQPLSSRGGAREQRAGSSSSGDSGGQTGRAVAGGGDAPSLWQQLSRKLFALEDKIMLQVRVWWRGGGCSWSHPAASHPASHATDFLSRPPTLLDNITCLPPHPRRLLMGPKPLNPKP